MNKTGDIITGIDSLQPQKVKKRNKGHKYPFDIRFHLHPSVQTQASPDGHSILLTMPNHDMWQFVSTFASFRLEDSVYLGESHEKKKTQQIVISGELDGTAEAKWQFRKL